MCYRLLSYVLRSWLTWPPHNNCKRRRILFLFHGPCFKVINEESTNTYKLSNLAFRRQKKADRLSNTNQRAEESLSSWSPAAPFTCEQQLNNCEQLVNNNSQILRKYLRLSSSDNSLFEMHIYFASWWKVKGTISDVFPFYGTFRL